MDASKIEDVIDFWNLRASGRQVLPLPKQFLEEESFRQVVVEFFDEHRRPWGKDGGGFDVASLIRSRHSTMEEMQAFSKSLSPPLADSKPGLTTQRMSLQHWYPRLWDEWARGKDGGVADVYGEDEEAIDIAGERASVDATEIPHPIIRPRELVLEPRSMRERVRLASLWHR